MTLGPENVSPAASLTTARVTARGVGYALFVTAGVVGTIFGPLSLVAVMGPDAAAIWGLWLTLGGVACLLGVLTGTWVGEFVGMPLLWSALIGYAYAVGKYTDSPLGEWRWGAGALLLAVCAGLLDRWLDVLAVSSIHRRISED